MGTGAGAGGGLYVSNARSNEDLAGPFSTFNVGIGIYTASFSHGGGVWDLNLGVAKSIGLSASHYTTYTFPINDTCR
jgi:hypothetical protein